MARPVDVTKAPSDLLTREQVLAAASHRDFEYLYVAKWGGSVKVIALSGTARDKYEADMVRLGPDGKVVAYNVEGKRARMLALSVVGPDDKPLFKAADILALGDQDAQAVDSVLAVAIRLSGMSELAVEAAKAVFTPDQPDSSGTG